MRTTTTHFAFILVFTFLLADVVSGQPVGTRFRDCSGCPEMVGVPSGSFEMGSPPHEEGRSDWEGPVHRVTIPQPFGVGIHEVTKREFGLFISATRYSMGGCDSSILGSSSSANWRDPGFKQTSSHPVVCVNWHDAQAYLAWLSGQTRQRYRMLSESEWEYVARVGTNTVYYWGDEDWPQCEFENGLDASTKDYSGTEAMVNCFDHHAWTSPVGSFPANGFGLHDILGNVHEWTADCWNESYLGAPSDGRSWDRGDCSQRVHRGGAYVHGPMSVRSAYRYGAYTAFRGDHTGFRVARTLSP